MLFHGIRWVKPVKVSGRKQVSKSKGKRRDTKLCYVCGKLGHYANECWKNNGPPRVPLRGQQKAAVAMEVDRDRKTDAQVHRFQHSLSHCSTCQCMSVPEATCCVAEIKTVPSSFKNTKFESSNGKVYKVCHLQCDKTIPFCRKDNLPTSPAIVNHQMVTLLRDTGCTGVIVSKQLVQESQYTGKSKLCQIIDGSIIKAPVAEITIDSPYYKGKTEAMVMATPVFDLILGNIQGAKSIVDADCKWTATHDDKEGCISSLQTASQAITRSMSQKLEKPLKLLKVPDIKLSVTPKMQDFIAEQEQDSTLKGVWEKAKDPEAMPRVTKNAETTYKVKTGILYRIHKKNKGLHSIPVEQIVLPQQKRCHCMELAHEAIFGGHMGTQKTIHRILTKLYWPGIHADVSRFCKSCDTCQRTTPKGKTIKVPLDRMPMIDVPFKRVAVDIVGRIAPASERGH